MPPLSFLDYDDSDGVDVDTEALRSMAAQIEQTLSDFKVEGQIVEICPGPVITMFEFSPAPGVKISKIARLSDDLAMALAAYSVRIVAPIPGKGVVGIEVPNPTREMVWLKEIIADDVFQGNEMQLPMALGKGTEGEPVTADLAKMPHLLVAGATGSGKSVAVNTMIVSLLYMNSPEDVRMIMVDPKMLEFNIYEDIPHLLLPVVTDPKQATVALNWVVNEMEQRYQKLADLGVRNLKGYNKKVERLTKQAELDHLDGKEESAAMRELDIDHNGKATHERMPYLVVVIDEFADLMMTASKDVEQAVARLAQKARAAGIHVILATQRPSTDVITGLIKANFPTRMALRVTSKTDSRVILDSNGAENLLGNGDMLFVPPGTSNLKRVHGAFVSENEIHQIVDFLKEQGDPQYDESILVEEDEEEESPLEQEWEKDEYYDDAVKVVVDSGKASISMIQRKLRVGYNRAARMVDRMAAEGIVGESDGCRPREVLVDTVPDHCK
ncbi:DNA translocase FtsK [Persicimonas caeni]|uniref:DNA translocase FtsK n=1 Tax=Persicimonas caeni TaxID=2292766 RepID=UPI001FEC6CDC|nr:DNA translocase FtsK [Persicimonas caeni]